jgi:SAM-dependent methyltransferase
MKTDNKSWYSEFLACPDCNDCLTEFDGVFVCKVCGYNSVVTTPLELKPTNPKPLTMVLPRMLTSQPSGVLDDLEISPPIVTYDGPAAVRDSKELMSELSKYLCGADKVLDLGCGPRDQAVPVEYLGYRYVGVDYSNKAADLLADAHALPFKENTFNCVLSYAVLEHLHNPFIALSEIDRLLKPGGVYIGTVSQGEPFHGSYFHHTAWGFISLIASQPNFEIKKIWGSGDTLGALSRMGKYPRVIKSLLAIIDVLHTRIKLLAPRKMRWTEKAKALDGLYRAGSIGFCSKALKVVCTSFGEIA